jgi:hypothetical protein
MKELLESQDLAPVREPGATFPPEERDRWARLRKEIRELSKPAR